MKVSIPTPCSENWNNMEQREKSRFCASCRKCVIDFTSSSDKEIIDYLNSQNGEVCGRFTREQLNRPLITQTSHYNKHFSIAASLLLITTLGFSSNIQIQQPLTTQQFDEIKPKKKYLQNKEIYNDTNMVKIRGVIIDSSDKSPIVGAMIQIKGLKMEAISDLDGNFELVMPRHINQSTLTLTISFVAYETKEIVYDTLKNKKDFVIELTPSDDVLGGLIIVTNYKNSYWRRLSNFFRRIF